MKNLHVLPKFADRWSHLYLEYGRLDKESNSLAFVRKDGSLAIPIDQLALVMLGPGTSVTHQAMKTLAENSCLVCWVGEQGVRVYAHNTGGTHGSTRLLRQAALYCDGDQRRQVAIRMYQLRFAERLPDDIEIESIRGMEGARVRNAYAVYAKQYGVHWRGRNYDQENWEWGDPLNRALSSANACLYGISHAAILSAGYSPAIGFIHTGKMLSFVYDVADFYKTEVAVPTAFSVVAEGTEEVERRTRLRCRDVFYESKLLDRILPDIAEVLHVGDVAGELPDELEGRIITLADRAQERRVSGEPERPSSG